LNYGYFNDRLKIRNLFLADYYNDSDVE